MIDQAETKTVLTKDPTEAAKFIRAGGVAAFPTETVYGLGANVFDAEAIEKIFAAKRRPNDNPLIVHVAELAQIADEFGMVGGTGRSLAKDLGPNARRLIGEFFPGPLTIVLQKTGDVPYAATAGLETVAVRMPANRLAIELIKACGVPLVAPSANLSGRPSSTTWAAVLEDLDGRIDCILPGDATEIGLESTVVDCSDDENPVLLRKGAVSLEKLREIVPQVELYEIGKGERTKSPGLRHKHYAPRADVEWWQGNRRENSAYIGIDEPAAKFELEKICADTDEYARELFAFFRKCDERHIKTIYCQKVAEDGIGAAIVDRIRRAAE